mgnify:CR=1 FL=1
MAYDGTIQNFEQVKSARMFDELMKRHPSAKDMLEAIKNAECFLNDGDELDAYACAMEDALERMVEDYRTEAELKRDALCTTY